MNTTLAELVRRVGGDPGDSLQDVVAKLIERVEALEGENRAKAARDHLKESPMGALKR